MRSVPEDLAPFVAGIWTLDVPASPAPQPPIAPDGCCEWIVHLGDAPETSRGGAWRRQPREFLFGQLREPLVLRNDRPMRCIAVRFHPHAAAPLFQISGSALVSEEITFPRFSGLADTASLERVLDRMLAHVRSMMREARTLDPLAAHACRALQVPDDARIAALARRLEVSARTLERRFVAAVGLSPKRYARIARMQRSLASLALPGARAIDVAHALGFTDQAHLTRELVALAGVRPAELLSPM